MNSLGVQGVSNLKEIKTVAIRYKIEDTDIEFEKKLSFLINLAVQDPVKWLEEFRETRKLCAWSENATVKILYSLVNKDLQKNIKDCLTFETAARQILNYSFPAARLSELYKAARKIKQNNYFLINDYARAVEESTKRIAACKNLSKKETADRCEESFLLGLSGRTQYELAKTNVDTMVEIIRYISKAENTIKNIGKRHVNANEVMLENLSKFSIEDVKYQSNKPHKKFVPSKKETSTLNHSQEMVKIRRKT